MNIVALVIFAIVALVILVQLYSVLGRKTGFRVEDKVLAQKPEEFDSAIKLERPAEGPKLPNLDLLKSRDVNFNEINFLEKARETYEQVVMAFHKGELDMVKDRLSEKVYGLFTQAVAARAQPVTDRVSFVDTPKADMDVIEFKDDTAQIRVRFLSELAYEDIAPASQAEPVPETAPETEIAPEGKALAKPAAKAEPARPETIHKRTAEYWTFQKGMRSPGGPWLLTRVEAAKA